MGKCCRDKKRRVKELLIFMSILLSYGCQSTPVKPLYLKEERINTLLISSSDIETFAEGMVEHLMLNHKLSSTKSYAFGKIELNVYKYVDTTLISNLIIRKIHDRTGIKVTPFNPKSPIQPNVNYLFEGSLSQIYLYDNGNKRLNSSLILKLVDENNGADYWAHEISLKGKERSKDWVFY